MLKILSCKQDKTKADNELSRLQLLKNAVINYSGGIVRHESQVRRAAARLREGEPDTARLLNNIVSYLHDVATAGNLDIGAWQDTPEKRSKHV
ncbi:MAG: hypothetical protein RSG77_05390 [Hafnia sp.]|uniref:hypothetical protein n=1 Tax=Hafnia sp. TaxID=1873498 RepID=UPI002FC9A766